ncbi:SMP-30/gluconolactonase/LRE family protein [Actinomadura meridiana]|uniref:SMP-30/gluconolactonase/LRE family protein n=1 Tax=Actinomadura meridiana TaxID=559626 RepID=A0ABP8CA73_9ACTN
MGEVRTLLDGRGLVESPRWHDGRLYFSDWSAGEVVAIDLDGRTEVVARVRSLPLCTAFLPDGQLLIVSSTDGRLLRRDDAGNLSVHAELGGTGWNDIALDGRGNAYVNRMGFDLASGEPVKPGGVSLAPMDGGQGRSGGRGGSSPHRGRVREVADDILFPNGMAVTPDDSTLIVADSYRHCLVAFDIGPDGDLTGRRVWADLGDGTPDGICLDEEGAVWYADVPNKRCVRVAEGGAVLHTVTLDRGGFACALGGPDGRTLFIVAADFLGMAGEVVTPGSGQVLVTQVDVPGVGRP